MTKAKPQALVSMGKWNQYDNLCCTQCRFAALQEPQMAKHLSSFHGASVGEVEAALMAVRPAAPEPEETAEIQEAVEEDG
jgi:3-deoxy-D-manno-octulosonic-acid transferase